MYMHVERSEDQSGVRHHLPLFSETGRLIVLELAERTASDPQGAAYLHLPSTSRF